MLYKLQPSHNATKTTKNICCEGIIGYSTVTKWFTKFCSGCKNPNNQARSVRPETVDSETVLQAIETNPVSSTQSFHPVWFVTFRTLTKASEAAELFHRLPKYCKTFDSS